MNLRGIYSRSILALFALLLFGCSQSERYHQTADSTPVNVPILAHVEDAHPHFEPYSLQGNKDYRVRGIDYKVWRDITSYKADGISSWYGEKFHGYKTSNGEIYNMYAMSAAHKNLPLPSYLKVTNKSNGRSVIVRVNDRGPFHSERELDLSYAAAYKLDMLKSGTAQIQVELIKSEAGSEFEQAFTQPQNYLLQLVAIKKRKRAQAELNKITAHYQVSGLLTPSGAWYQLQLGPFTHNQAQIYLEKVRSSGFPQAFMVKQ